MNVEMGAVSLNVIETGVEGIGAGEPVVILHGLLGAARNWGMIAKELGRDRRVCAIDMPNHGASPWFDRMDYPFMAAQVADWIAARFPRVALMGHSMGGKAAMTVALTRPELVSRLIVVDIAPVVYTHGFSDYIAAMRAAPLGTVTKRAEAEAFLAQSIPDPRVRAFLMQNLDQDRDGYRWRTNIDVLDREMSAIVGFPPELTGRVFDGPTLFVSGGQSDYVRPQDQDRITAFFPKAERTVIADAGHWLHADKPQEFLGVVKRFLD